MTILRLGTTTFQPTDSGEYLSMATKYENIITKGSKVTDLEETKN
jgi:hypothetical protein